MWAGACATDRKSFKMEEERKRSRHGTELSKFRGPKLKPPELKSNKEDMRGDTSYTITSFGWLSRAFTELMRR